jgi:phosphatidate phosphatase PAH1
MRRTLMTAAAGFALALAAAVPSLAAGPVDTCREVSAADAAKLKNRPAVVADIDGTLSQYVLLDYGPTNAAFLDMGVAYPREDAALMMNIYLRRGYSIVYMAGRPRQMKVLGKSMCEATLDWLEANGFPTEPGDTLLLLRDRSQAVVDAKDRGTAMAEWMGDHGTDLFRSMVEGVKKQYSIVPAYGYVDSDVIADAYLDVGVPAGHIFTIGNKGVSRLGYKGTHAIVGPEANPGYAQHIRDFVVPDVPNAK